MRRLSLAFVLFCVASMVLLRGQTYDPQTDTYSYTGDLVPKYYVAAHFFKKLFWLQGLPDKGENYRRELEAIGIKENSWLERELIQSAREAVAAIDCPGVEFNGNIAEWEDQRNNHLRQQVAGTSSALNRLRASMRAEGISTEMLEDHLEKRIRPECSVHTLRGPISEGRWRILKEFESPATEHQ